MTFVTEFPWFYYCSCSKLRLGKKIHYLFQPKAWEMHCSISIVRFTIRFIWFNSIQGVGDTNRAVNPESFWCLNWVMNRRNPRWIACCSWIVWFWRKQVVPQNQVGFCVMPWPSPENPTKLLPSKKLVEKRE